MKSEAPHNRGGSGPSGSESSPGDLNSPNPIPHGTRPSVNVHTGTTTSSMKPGQSMPSGSSGRPKKVP